MLLETGETYPGSYLVMCQLVVGQVRLIREELMGAKLSRANGEVGVWCVACFCDRRKRGETCSTFVSARAVVISMRREERRQIRLLRVSVGYGMIGRG